MGLGQGADLREGNDNCQECTAQEFWCSLFEFCVEKPADCGQLLLSNNVRGLLAVHLASVACRAFVLTRICRCSLHSVAVPLTSAASYHFRHFAVSVDGGGCAQPLQPCKRAEVHGARLVSCLPAPLGPCAVGWAFLGDSALGLRVCGPCSPSAWVKCWG